GAWQVLYYFAINDSKDIDYVISPDKLDEFIQNIDTYYAQAHTIQTPPPEKGGSSWLQGPRFPTARDAWDGGIVPYHYALGDLPWKGAYMPDQEYHLWLLFKMAGEDPLFRIIPALVGKPHPRVRFYSAFSEAHGVTLYAISPDQVDKFADGAA